MQRIFNYFYLCLTLFLPGCGMFSHIKEVSIPTPLGSFVIKLDENRKVPDLSTKKLGKIPLGVEDNALESGDYRSIPNLKFAIWIPDTCKYEAGSILALDPGYNRDMLSTFQKMTNSSDQQLEEMPFSAQLSAIYLLSDSEQFHCGSRTSVKIVKGSLLSGSKVTEKKLVEMKEWGNIEPGYPVREIKVTAVKKSKFIQAGYLPSTVNLLLWTNYFSLPYDAKYLYVGKDSDQLYVDYQVIFENVEIENNPRTIKFHGVTGVFEGSSYLYFVDVVAQIGETTETQWRTLQAVLESFRYE